MIKMYRLLDIIYDHSEEIAFLTDLTKQEKQIKGIPKKLFKKRIAELRRQWFDFHKSLKNLHRKTGVPTRSSFDSIGRYNDLANSLSMDTPFIRKRLALIKKYWPNLMAYHRTKNAPATNNLVENYYSSTLKQQRKKQYRTDEGLQTEVTKLLKTHDTPILDPQDYSGMYFIKSRAVTIARDSLSIFSRTNFAFRPSSITRAILIRSRLSTSSCIDKCIMFSFQRMNL
jgi:hypothetical protein